MRIGVGVSKVLVPLENLKLVKDTMSSDEAHSDQDHGDAQRCLDASNSNSTCAESDDDTCPEDPCTEIEVPEQNKHLAEANDFAYEVLSVEQIMQRQRNIIDEVNNVLALSPQVTRIILNHFKWDRDKLFEQYFESDLDDFFRRAHIINPFSSRSSLSMHNAKPSNGTLQSVQRKFCHICYDYCEELVGLGCGHAFCFECWKLYLANKTCTEGLAHSITCAASNCDILVDDISFMRLADDPEVIERYQQLVTNTFVECNSLMRWCPAPNCMHAIEANSVEAYAVRCKCGQQCCFLCGENWHEPASCALLKNWLQKCNEDSETSNWIANNTKECPKCNVTIEKNGGCNHMVCKNPTCRYDFCWVCLGSWEPHGSSWYSCNRFEEDESKQARLAQKRYRSDMSRYLHYYNRYMNHMQSLRLENKLYVNVQRKMDDMQEEMSWMEVQFLKDAVDVLCHCRNTLMYTYVFAYYLRSNNQKIIFLNNQRDMEIATEKISECLEREITVKNMHEVKQKVLDLSNYCKRRRMALLHHVREGYETDWWEFIDESKKLN